MPVQLVKIVIANRIGRRYAGETATPVVVAIPLPIISVIAQDFTRKYFHREMNTYCVHNWRTARIGLRSDRDHCYDLRAANLRLTRIAPAIVIGPR